MSYIFHKLVSTTTTIIATNATAKKTQTHHQTKHMLVTLTPIVCENRLWGVRKHETRERMRKERRWDRVQLFSLVSLLLGSLVIYQSNKKRYNAR